MKKETFEKPKKTKKTEKNELRDKKTGAIETHVYPPLSAPSF